MWGELDKNRLLFCLVRSTPTRGGRTSAIITLSIALSGPPPRVWGELQRVGGRDVVVRSTPTRVGRTSAASTSTQRASVHPHACGENSATWIWRVISFGPPPRVWGERRQRRILAFAIRSTPTRVGRTLTRSDCITLAPVHPHACGENEAPAPSQVCGIRSTPTRVGRTSSPHGPRLRLRSTPTRVGRTLLQRVIPEGIRSTPTRVGRTPASPSPSVQTAVHPHACGENARAGEQGSSDHGPPPRVWGERPRAWYCPVIARSTPTRVGRTSVLLPTPPGTPVHPHACGENFPLQLTLVYRPGPPPRVWGERPSG